MTSFLRFLLSTTILTVVLSFLASASMAQAYKVGSPDAAALAMEFHSGDSYRISQAISDLPYYEDVYEDNTLFVDVDPYVEKSIISALDSQLDVYFSWDLGEGKEFFFEDVITPLAVYLTRIDDPDAIPVLLRAIEISAASRIALAEHGPDVVPVVIDYMNSSEPTIDYIIGSFFYFENIVALWRPLDAETHTTFRQLAIDYMQGYVPEHLADDSRNHILRLDGASLASVLGDEDLKPMVESLRSEFPILIESYLKRWHNQDEDAADRDQIAPND